MYKINRDVIHRAGSLLGAMVFMAGLGTSLLPGLASADALNPLTDRSLTLSSSAPGWDYTDGSGNTTYAPPNSGANGKQTGNTFDFKVSTNSTSSGTNIPIKGMTLQYCTTSAGNCTSPGDDTYDTTGGAGNYTRNADTATTADLKVVASTPTEVSTTDFSSIIDTSTGMVKAVPNRNGSQGNYVVYYDNAGTWTQVSGWTMTVSNVETGTVGAGTATGANNYITLAKSAGIGLASGTRMKVIFFGTDTNYITNPGSGAFFVKINTYNSDTVLTAANVIDGGVTVANVMNQSIAIQTKVLETMQFSVGTVDPDTLSSTDTDGNSSNGVQSPLKSANLNDTHGPCDPILGGLTPSDPVNVLKLGNQAAESSLAVDHTYITHSYWRLSSNSSAGATVYYAGVSLSNTVGDVIDPIGPTAAAPLKGKEQFGLAIATQGPTSYATNYTSEDNAGTGIFENGADNGLGFDATTTSDNSGNASYHAPQLAPLAPLANYGGGGGIVNTEYGSINSAFAFDPTSNLIPVPMADESSDVVDCVTARIRYIANIAAITPAGIYTTKVNYIAAPQY